LGGSSKIGPEQLYDKTIRYYELSKIRTNTLKKVMLYKRVINGGFGQYLFGRLVTGEH
jgi:hypothetical protein